ncbi:MAG: hypothetical protein ACLR56_15725 [Oscillospiraceae bacterium]
MKLPKKIISCGVAASLIISVFAAKGIPESKSGDTRFTLPDTTMLESETNRHTMYASSAKTAEKIGTEGYELKLGITVYKYGSEETRNTGGGSQNGQYGERLKATSLGV